MRRHWALAASQGIGISEHPETPGLVLSLVSGTLQGRLTGAPRKEKELAKSIVYIPALLSILGWFGRQICIMGA